MQGIDTYMSSCPQSLSSLMSTKGFSSMNHQYKQPCSGWANESDELDVFEATRYFSGAIDGMGVIGGFDSHGAMAVEERVPRSAQSRSLDERLISSSTLLQMKNKKCKQPSSPGARLVGYLNSFFHQAASPRKLKCLNPASTTQEPSEDEVEKSLGERGRRSSTSNSQRTMSSGSKSSKLCGRSSFTTPDIHPNNSIPSTYKCSRGQRAVTFCSSSEAWGRRSVTEVWNNSTGHNEKDCRLPGIRFEERNEHDRVNKWVLNKPRVEHVRRDWLLDYELPLVRGRKNFGRRREEVEDSEESESDLFELKINDQGDGLPVFATTDIEAIKRKTAISSTAP